MPTQFTSVGIRNTLKVGTGFLAGLVAASGISLFLGGDAAFDLSQNANPAISAGTGDLLQSFDGQSGTICTNTGGLFKYTSCSAQNPSSTGTKALLDVSVDFAVRPVPSLQTTCVTSPNNTTTGSSIFKYKVATGSGHLVAASGSQLPVILPPSWYIRCWHNVTPGTALRAKLKIQARDFYEP